MIVQNSHLHEKYAYIQLAKISNGNINLCKQGLDIIENVMTGHLALIAIQGQPTILFRNYIYEVSKLQISPLMDNHSSVWISSVPYTQKGWKKKFFILQTIAKTKQDALRIHLFVSAISTVILLNITEKTNLQFLYSLNGRLVVSQQLQTMSIKDYVGSLYVLMRENREYQNVQDRSRQFTSMLNDQKIYDYVKQNYDIIESYVFTTDNLIQKKQYLLLNTIIKQFQETLKVKATSGLMFGPILAEYIKIIVEQINKYGMVELQKAENSIEMDEGYEVHNQIIKQYTMDLRSSVPLQQSQPIPNFDKLLKQKKQTALQKFTQKCDDLKYYGKVKEYIEINQQQLKRVNNQLAYKYNWDLLQKQTKDLQAKIKTNKNPTFVKKEIDEIVNRYQSKALGDSKYQILSDYLNKFVPGLLEQPTNNKEDFQTKYKTLKAQNNNLKNLIKQQQKKKQPKGCCVIM